MPSITLNKDADLSKEIEQASHYGQHSKHKTSFEQNGTFQKRLIDIFADKLLKH